MESNLTDSHYLQPMWQINNNFFFYMLGFLVIAFILILAAVYVITRDSHNVMVLENPNMEVHSQQRILIAIQTSPYPGSGCRDNATISIVVQGVLCESDTFILSRQMYPYRKFLRGCLDLFLIHFDHDVGHVRGLKFIIDNKENKQFFWRICEISTFDPEKKSKVHFVISHNTPVTCGPSTKAEVLYKPHFYKEGKKFQRIIEYVMTNHYLISIASPVHVRNFGRVARCIFAGFVLSLLAGGALITYIVMLQYLFKVSRLEFIIYGHVMFLIVFLVAYLFAWILENSRPQISDLAMKFPETRRAKLGGIEEKVAPLILPPPKSSVVEDATLKNIVETNDKDSEFAKEFIKTKLRQQETDKNKSAKGHTYGYYEEKAMEELKSVNASSKSKKSTDINKMSTEVVGKVLAQAKVDATVGSLEIETNKLRRHYKRDTAGDASIVDKKIIELYKLHDMLRYKCSLDLFQMLHKSHDISYNDMANFAQTQQILIFCAEKLGNLQSYHSGKLEKFYDVPYFRFNPSSTIRQSLVGKLHLDNFNTSLKHDPKTVYRSTSEHLAVDIKKPSSFEAPDHVSIHSVPVLTTSNRIGIAADAIVDYSVNTAKDFLSTHNVQSIRDNLQKFCDILLKQVLQADPKPSHTVLGYRRLIEHFARCYVTNEIQAQNAGLSLYHAMTDDLFFPVTHDPPKSDVHYIFSVLSLMAEDSFKSGVVGNYEPCVSPLTSLAKIQKLDKKTPNKELNAMEEKVFSHSPIIPSDIFAIDRKHVLAYMKVNHHYKQIVCDILYDFSTQILAQDVLHFIEKVASVEKQYEMLNVTSNFLAKRIQQLVQIWKELQKNDNFVVDVLFIILLADLRDIDEYDKETAKSVQTTFKSIWKNMAHRQKQIDEERAKKDATSVDVSNTAVRLCPRVISRSIDEVFVELENPLYMFHKALGIKEIFNVLTSSTTAIKSDWIKKAITDAQTHFEKQGYFRIENSGEFLSRSIVCEYLSGRLNKYLTKDISETSPNLDKFNVLLLKRVEYYFLVNITDKYKEIAKLTVQRLLAVLDQELRFCQHLRCRRDYISSYIIQSVDRMAECCKNDPIIVLTQILKNQLLETKHAINLDHLHTAVNEKYKKIDATHNLRHASKSKETKDVVKDLLELRDQLSLMDGVVDATDKVTRQQYIQKEQPFITDQVIVNMQQVIDSRNMYIINDETRRGLWYYRSIIMGEHKNRFGHRWRQVVLGIMWALIIASLVYTALKGIDLRATEAASWMAVVLLGFFELIFVFEIIRLGILYACTKNWRVPPASTADTKPRQPTVRN